MKKSWRLKVSSAIASFAMVMSLMVAPVFAASNTIQLDADRSEALTVESGETVILDLNGHTMKGNIINKGTLTIKDSQSDGKVSVENNHAVMNIGHLTVDGGTIDALSHQKAAIYNDVNGVATINGGTFTRSMENGKTQESSGGNSFYAILNHGTMTINNGNFVQNGQFSSLVDNGWYTASENTSGVSAHMTIKGGTFTGGKYSMKNDDFGIMTISGGSFSNTTVAALLNWNVATVSGGTFTSTGNAVYNSNDIASSIGDLTITGGSFVSGSGSKAISNKSVTAVKLTGGTYNTNDIGVEPQSGYKTYVQSGKYIVAPQATDIRITGQKESVMVNDEFKLSASLSPIGTLDTVTWSSSDTTIATIDSDGNVKALKGGKVTITAKVGEISKSIVINVKVIDVEVPTINPSQPSDKVEVGVQDKDSQAVINNSVNDILNKVIDNQSIDKSVMSEKTVAAIKKAIADGKTVTSKVAIDTLDESKIDNAIVNAVKELVAKFAKVNNTEAKIAQYLDLSVLLVAGGDELGTVNQLTQPVAFTVAMPKDLIKDGRKFYVVRVHEGVAEKLETTMNEDGTLTFKTDKFSTYALVYEDEVKTTDVAVKTNDNNSTMLYLSVAALAVVAGAIIVMSKKREELLNK